MLGVPTSIGTSKALYDTPPPGTPIVRACMSVVFIVFIYEVDWSDEFARTALWW
jgi:hypothetical protein